MYQKRQKSVCEECGTRTHYLGYYGGKHLCGNCEAKLRQELMWFEKYKERSIF